MKKAYVKPGIMFENFSLSTNIAGSCEVDVAQPTNADGCGYQPEGLAYTIFMTGMSGCTRQYKEGESYNGLCYHVPTEAYNLFNS